jgi:hypothetical protein
MSFQDLEEARRHHAALLEIIIHHPGGWSDRAALNKVVELCREATSATDDAHCVKHIETIADYAADLFSEQAHRKWGRGKTSGAALLRLEIVRALHEFNHRLSAIEARRRASGARAEMPPVRWHSG